MSYAGSVAWKLHTTARILAWVGVALGVVLSVAGGIDVRNRTKAYECAHAQLTDAKLEALFTRSFNSAEREVLRKWAEATNVSITWDWQSNDSGRLTVEVRSVFVPTCGATLERLSRNIPPFFLDNPILQFGLSVFLYSLIAVGLLRWLKWLFRATPSTPAT